MDSLSLATTRRLTTVGLVLAAAWLLLGGTTSSAGAASWTQLTSGTTADISAVEYQSPTRFWFATSAGELFTRQPDGSFLRTRNVPGTSFTSIAFQATGSIGLAGATNGNVYRSADGGASWSIVGSLLGSNNDCSSTATPDGNVRSVRWAGDTDAYIFSNTKQVFHSTTGVLWTDINHKTTGGCKASFNDGPTDGYFLPGSPHQGWVVDQNFGKMFFSTDWTTNNTALVTTAAAGNGASINRRMAVDATNPNKQWVIARSGDGNGSYVQRTTDAWGTAQDWHFRENDRTRAATTDVATAGGTVVSVGAAGQVENSSNGADFFSVPAAGTLANEDWNAVDMFDAANAAIGGVGGALAVSTNANVTPDIDAPTATGIAGPTAPHAGVASTYSLGATDTGGSGLDTAHYTWTVAGLPTIVGPTATFTFPSAGAYTVRVSFRDLAGNAGPDQSLFVTVGAPLPAPHVTFTGANGSGSPLPANATVVKIGGVKYAVVKVTGTLKPPAGVARSVACTGKVTLLLSSGGKRVSTRRANISTKTCGFSIVAKVPLSKVRKGKLKAVLSIPKTTTLSAFSSSRTIHVKGH